MSTLRDAQRRYRDYAMDRSAAMRELQLDLDEDRAEIDRLRARIQEKEASFDAEWKRRKADLFDARNNAIKQAAREGMNGAEILRELGTNNTQLVYKLISEAMSEAAQEAMASEPSEEEVDHYDKQLEGVVWDVHPHTGVHRWLLSKDRHFYKRYAPDATPEDEDPEWFVAMVDGNYFVAGSKDLYERTSDEERERRLGMLQSLLDGTFTDKIRPGVPPFNH